MVISVVVSDSPDMNKRLSTKEVLEEEEEEEATDMDMDMCPPHPLVSGADRCLRCNECLLPSEANDVVGGTLLPFNYIDDGLRIRAEFVEIMRESATANILEQEKLFLVLDLDHTLLHSCDVRGVGVDVDVVHDPRQGLFELGALGFFTKLRPYVQWFLKNVSAMFDLCIYTMGDREYAREIARLLDPNDEYFHQKVISRSDCREAGKKDLDVVLVDPCAVVVLDDTMLVWTQNSQNVVHIDRFFFSPFKDSRQGGNVEEEEDGGCCYESRLVDINCILERIHGEYFDSRSGGGGGGGGVDVRNVMEKIRKRTLGECRVVFTSGETEEASMAFRLWDMAELMGAVCSVDVTPEVTHVVCCGLGWTDDAEWAVANDKFLVTSKWLEEAYFSWERPGEEEYTPISQWVEI